MVGLELEERGLVEDFGQKCQDALVGWDLVIKNYTAQDLPPLHPIKSTNNYENLLQQRDNKKNIVYLPPVPSLDKNILNEIQFHNSQNHPHHKTPNLADISVKNGSIFDGFNNDQNFGLKTPISDVRLESLQTNR
jgi:hypothetical protein